MLILEFFNKLKYDIKCKIWPKYALKLQNMPKYPIKLKICSNGSNMPLYALITFAWILLSSKTLLISTHLLIQPTSGGAWTFYLGGLNFYMRLNKNNFYLTMYNSEISFVTNYLVKSYLIWTEIYFVDIKRVYRVNTCMECAGP